MKKYRVIWVNGPVFELDDRVLEEVKDYVERYSPMKRGWTGRWITALNNKAWKYQRFNSKGKYLRGFDVVVEELS